MIRSATIAVLLAVSSGMALAQQSQPYAAFRDRPIKALSGQEVADLRAGRGMGLALAAELNGYPGPAHVLEHAAALGLNEAQRARTQALHDAMKAEAVPLGELLIAQEANLDGQFRDRTVTSASLTAATEGIGATQAALRAAHLRYHLTMLDVLTPDQVRRYRELRGYTGSAGHSAHGAHGAGRPGSE